MRIIDVVLHLRLLHPIHRLVKVKHEVRSVRDLEPRLPVVETLGDVLLELVEEPREVDDDAVTDQGLALVPDDAARQDVEVIRLVTHYIQQSMHVSVN